MESYNSIRDIMTSEVDVAVENLKQCLKVEGMISGCFEGAFAAPIITSEPSLKASTLHQPYERSLFLRSLCLLNLHSQLLTSDKRKGLLKKIEPPPNKKRAQPSSLKSKNCHLIHTKLDPHHLFKGS
jgi:hypothetical protein